MENIEEHCDEHLTDSDAASLKSKPGLPQSKEAPAPTSPSPAETGAATTNASTGNSQTTPRPTVAPSNKSLGASRGKFISRSTLSLSSSSAASDFSAGMNSAAASAIQRMPHLHKLEKKHSSGDLHSRLKTRKLLGVGETDDGDIHRSKLSQILGHSDQLYIRLPYGLRLWQLSIAVMFTLTGLWALILPSHLFDVTPNNNGIDSVSFPGRLYGGAILSLSILYWTTLSSQDRDVIRICMLTSVVYFVIQFIVSAFSSSTMTTALHIWLGTYVLVIFRAAQVLGGFYFYILLARDLRHYR